MLGIKMSPSAEYYDLCHEDTFDLTGQIFRALHTQAGETAAFSATVPPHLSEAFVAHWDDSELW